MRGECGAAALPLQVFSGEHILIRPDKTRICLILLPARTLNYSRLTLSLCLLSLCEKGAADGSSSRARPTAVNFECLSPDPTPLLNSVSMLQETTRCVCVRYFFPFEIGLMPPLQYVIHFEYLYICSWLTVEVQCRTTRWLNYSCIVAGQNLIFFPTAAILT